jgi:hypothetical protein
VSDLKERLRKLWLHDGYDQSYQPQWAKEAADRIEQLELCLNERDDFIVKRGLWSEFVETIRGPLYQRPTESEGRLT